MGNPSTPSSHWTPSLVATLIVRFVGATCLVLGTFWLFDWVAYRIDYHGVVGSDRDIGFAVYAGRYLLVGGLLLLFEPAFARWLLGGRLSGADSSPRGNDAAE